MTVLAESALRLEPSALALRALGGWLAEATGVLDEGTRRQVLGRAELAVHEACMNVVDHAHLPEGADLSLRLVLSTEHLTVWVCDAGEEFHLSEVATPPTDTLQERGYGVKIIRSLVSDLTYRRSGSRNELEMRIDLEPHPATKDGDHDL